MAIRSHSVQFSNTVNGLSFLTLSLGFCSCVENFSLNFQAKHVQRCFSLQSHLHNPDVSMCAPTRSIDFNESFSPVGKIVVYANTCLYVKNINRHYFYHPTPWYRPFPLPETHGDVSVPMATEMESSQMRILAGL